MKKIFSYIVETIKEEYKFLISLLLIFIIFMYPMNYYIVIGGGTSDVSSRIHVEDSYKSKGSFNISYVEQLRGTVITYLLSYVIPSWERESINDYKYTDEESIQDIEFRGDLDLAYSNSNAMYWAYSLANKEVKKVDSKLYVIMIIKDFETPLKISDQILSIDGNTYESIDEYKEYMQTLNEGDYVTLKVLRNDKEIEIKSKLYNYKDKLMLGIGLQLVREYETDPKVSIKFNNSESGPSGGLITALEIYNQLTKKDLTHGLKITGTGTIEMDGTIGDIGGVEYKILGASQDKTDVFLVPEGNYKDAVNYKKRNKLKIKIIKVKNIEDAIKKIDNLK